MASRELIANRQRQEGRRLPANATTNAAVRSAVPIERRTARSRWAGPPQGRRPGAVASLRPRSGAALIRSTKDYSATPERRRA
jgi:hypothetical protein